MMDIHDELGLTMCHFCGIEVPDDPKSADWSLVPRYNKSSYKGKKYVWRCPRCQSLNKKKFLDWLYPGEEIPENTFGRR